VRDVYITSRAKKCDKRTHQYTTTIQIDNEN